jgi:hypothetical protein
MFEHRRFGLEQAVIARLKENTRRRVRFPKGVNDDDCLLEGIFYYKQPPLHHEYDRYAPWPPYVKPYKYDCDNLKYFCTPRAAFHCLINRLSGCGTWEHNEWQFAYTFKLIK